MSQHVPPASTPTIFESLELRRLMSVYYVDPLAGSDLNSGRSPRLAWQALSSVNSHAFKSGDRVLLTGTFSGQSISIGANDAGISIDSYTYNPASRKLRIGAPAVATLSDVPGDGIVISASHVSIADLVITANPASLSSGNYFDGVHLLNTTSANLTGETINRVNVSGFAYAGLCLQGWNSTTTDSAGFSNVVIENSSFFANAVSGIFTGTGNNTGNEFASTFPADFYINSRLTINRCQAYDNAGFNPALTAGIDPSNLNNGNASSGGIFISSVSNATIENSTAWGNCFDANGGVGIWAFDSMRVNFQADQSFDNKTATTVDGDGFDFDHGVVNSIMQRDYSHGNDGNGFLLTTFGGTSNNTGDIIRFCISDDDGQLNSQAGIQLFASADQPLIGEQVYNNTVIVGPSIMGTPSALFIAGDGSDMDSVNIFNNVFDSAAPAPALTDNTDSPSVKLEGNDYWTAGGNFIVDSLDVSYTSLASWRAASADEVTSIGQPVGSNEDPAFLSDAASDLPIAQVGNLSLPVRSALRHQGVALTQRAVRYVRTEINPPVIVTDLVWYGLGPRTFFNRVANVGLVGAG